jgi:hypothetical protein
MKYLDASLPHISRPDWQISGKLELTANPNFDRTVGKWLTAILNPFELRTKRPA